MIIKLIGLGLRDYTRDAFNIFDASLVIISLIDFIILQIPQFSMGTTSGSTLLAFRGIRLLRVFKLARSWRRFRELLQQIMFTVKEVTYFLVLLLICMFIFSLLGMELYGQKIRFNKDGFLPDADNDTDELLVSPRPNFDTFYMAFTSIFIVFIGEDWQTVMHSHYRVEGVSALFFFPFLYICLHLILLNLFLAILLQNFDTASKVQRKQEVSDLKAIDKIMKKVKRTMDILSCKTTTKAKVTPSALTLDHHEAQIKSDVL